MRVYTHGELGTTNSESAQHFRLGKTLSHFFSCAPDGVGIRVTDFVESRARRSASSASPSPLSHPTVCPHCCHISFILPNSWQSVCVGVISRPSSLLSHPSSLLSSLILPHCCHLSSFLISVISHLSSLLSSLILPHSCHLSSFLIAVISHPSSFL